MQRHLYFHKKNLQCSCGAGGLPPESLLVQITAAPSLHHEWGTTIYTLKQKKLYELLNCLLKACILEKFPRLQMSIGEPKMQQLLVSRWGREQLERLCKWTTDRISSEALQMLSSQPIAETLACFRELATTQLHPATPRSTTNVGYKPCHSMLKRFVYPFVRLL